MGTFQWLCMSDLHMPGIILQELIMDIHTLDISGPIAIVAFNCSNQRPGNSPMFGVFIRKNPEANIFKLFS